MSATVSCVRCGKDGPALAWPPFPGDAGREVVQSACQSCWSAWLEVQTRLINEYRLRLHDPEHQARLVEQCRIFLGLQEGTPLDAGPPEDGNAPGTS